MVNVVLGGTRVLDRAIRNVEQVDLLALVVAPPTGTAPVTYVLVAIPELGLVWPVFRESNHWALTQVPGSQLPPGLTTPSGWYRAAYDTPIGTLEQLTVRIYNPDGSRYESNGGYALLGIKYRPFLQQISRMPEGASRTLLLLDSTQHVINWPSGEQVYDMVLPFPSLDKTGLLAPQPNLRNVTKTRLLAMSMPPLYDGVSWEPYVRLSIPELGLVSWPLQAQFFNSSEDTIRWQVIEGVHSKELVLARTVQGYLTIQLHSAEGQSFKLVTASQTCNRVQLSLLLEIWSLPIYPY